jgi:hypothetical protein
MNTTQSSMVIASDTLKSAYLRFKKDEPSAIPKIVRFFENPASPLPFPGQISLREHDYVHVLLGRGQSLEDEAFVVGFTMGTDARTTRLHLLAFRFLSRVLYPPNFRIGVREWEVFEQAFALARRKKLPALNRFNFEPYQDCSVDAVREVIGISSDCINCS